MPEEDEITTEAGRMEDFDEEAPTIAATDPDTDAQAGADALDGDAGPVPVVHLRKVSRWYGDVIAVNDLSVEIEPGITGLLGPNGAGKSTLIKMLVGLMRPSTGSVRVLGEDPWNNTALLKRIGYVPEAPPPWRELTGLDAATRAGRLSGLGEGDARRRAREALERVGLTHVSGRRVATYSHGMGQRLKLAISLLHDPDFLILDEPLLGSDPVARRDLLQLIRELGDQGKSVLVSTHVLPDVEALTDRILVLSHGRLMAYGGVAEIRDLLERYPRTVRIGTSDARRLGSEIWSWPSVLSLETTEGALVVRTKEPAVFYDRLQELLASGRVPFASVTSPDDNVEAVFRYLVG